MEILTANRSGQTRTEIVDGRKYLVAPLSMIVPGVLNGSKGPLLYPLDEISRNADAWNGMPIVLGHPMDGDRAISARSPGVLDKLQLGTVYNARVNGKLSAEGWFDIERTKRIAPETYAKLVRGEPEELSTGLFTDNHPVKNGKTEDGRSYVAVARNYRPDHLAILPGKRGACSINDGCGVNINEASGINNAMGAGNTRPSKMAQKIAKATGSRALKDQSLDDGFHHHFRSDDPEKAARKAAESLGEEAEVEEEDGIWTVEMEMDDGDHMFHFLSNEVSSEPTTEDLTPYGDWWDMIDNQKPSFNDLQVRVGQLLRQRFGNASVVDLFDDSVVYLLDTVGPVSPDYAPPIRYYRIGYSVDRSGDVILDDQGAQEVSRETTYRPVGNEQSWYDLVSNACSCPKCKKNGMQGGSDGGIDEEDETTENAFCPTGKGGGQKNTCGKKGSGSSGGKPQEERPLTAREQRRRDKGLPPPVRPFTMNALPTADLEMSPNKACQILKDGSVHGKKLTKKQRGMFGVRCGEKVGNESGESLTIPEWVGLLSPSINGFCPTGKGGGRKNTCSSRGKNKGKESSAAVAKHGMAQADAAREAAARRKKYSEARIDSGLGKKTPDFKWGKDEDVSMVSKPGSKYDVKAAKKASKVS